MKPAASVDAVGSPIWRSARRPFSYFDFSEENFNNTPKEEISPDSVEVAVRRLFSEARKQGARTIGVEQLRTQGVLRDENLEIKRLYPDFKPGQIFRLSFWRTARKDAIVRLGLTSNALLGYMVVKQDFVPSEDYAEWHVFESVFLKYNHVNNCVPREHLYQMKVGARTVAIRGVMYGQQNRLNKACAQVAIRSLCSRILPSEDLCYSRINRLATNGSASFLPKKGLSPPQIRRVLKRLGIRFIDTDYTRQKQIIRRRYPFQKFLYAGVESGGGALLGFAIGKEDHHIISFFGHTFNQDLWVANASSAYFWTGKRTRYIPSETWLSAFIGHDDNFGSNFCVPRLYIDPKRVKYVVTILPPGVAFDGVRAELIGSHYINLLVRHMKRRKEGERNRWLQRLIGWVKTGRVVLRAIALSKAHYFSQLKSTQDWERKGEAQGFVNLLESVVPCDHVWIVEFSLPELFPTNLRKLGEIVLDATAKPRPIPDYRNFLFARLPGAYYFIRNYGPLGRPNFVALRSKLKSHTPLFRV